VVILTCSSLYLFSRLEIQDVKHRHHVGGADESKSVDTRDYNNNQTNFNQSSKQQKLYSRDSRFHHITMTSEDLLQPGHIVKERWKVVSPAFILHTLRHPG
jgi:hypothetical protein